MMLLHQQQRQAQRSLLRKGQTTLCFQVDNAVCRLCEQTQPLTTLTNNLDRLNKVVDFVRQSGRELPTQVLMTSLLMSW